MRILGLIPARGGSTRLARKNMLELGGLPLIAWSIGAAKLSEVFTHVVVSTEDDEIANYTRSLGTEVLDRPAELAQSDTPTLPVVRHAMAFYRNCDAVMVLQPTSPFRESNDIVAAAKIFCSCVADTVVSLVEAPDKLSFTLGGAYNRVRPATNLYVPNGAIYAMSREAIESGYDFYDGVCYGYVMPQDRSLDIDTAADLGRARAVIIEKCTQACG